MEVETWLKGLDQDATWHEFSVPASSPPGRASGAESVWLRTRLPQDLAANDVLYIPGFDQVAELYLGGKKIFASGDFDASGRGKFRGYSWYLIPLPRDAGGQRLYFRVWSPHVNIGIIGQPTIGKRHDFIQGMYADSMPVLLVAVLMLAMGAAAGIMFLAKPSQREYLYFAAHSLFGIWFVCRTPLKILLFPDLQFWLTTELVVLVIEAWGLFKFCSTITGAKQGLGHGLLGFLGILFTCTLLIAGIFWPEKSMAWLLPAQVWILCGCAVMFIDVGKAVFRGQREAQWVAAGFVVFFIFATLEVLMALGLILPDRMGGTPLMPWASLLMLISLAAVLVLRFHAVYRRIGRLKNQLDVILRGTRDMALAREKHQAATQAVQSLVENLAFRTDFSARVFWRGEHHGIPSYRPAILMTGGRSVEPTLEPQLSTEDCERMEAKMAQGDIQVSAAGNLEIPILWGMLRAGLLVLEGSIPGSIGDEERHFMGTLMQSLAMSVQNIDHLQETKARAVLDAELVAAQAVQEALLPTTSATLPGVQIATAFRPAAKTGGDWLGYYYDRANHRLDLFVADVTGHGFASALLTGVACGGIFAAEELLAAAGDGLPTRQSAPDRLLSLAQAINKVVHQCGRSNRLMTMLLGSLELDTGIFWLVNAGHNWPLHITCDTHKVNGITAAGPRLGYGPVAKFQPKSIQLHAGDRLFLYTDGLVENYGPDQQTLRDRELKRLLSADQENAEVHQGLLEFARSLWCDEPSADDVTTFLLQWMGPVRPDQNPLTGLDFPGATGMNRSESLASS